MFWCAVSTLLLFVIFLFLCVYIIYSEKKIVYDYRIEIAIHNYPFREKYSRIFCQTGGDHMADNFGLKLGIDGEREFKKALSKINRTFKVLGSEMKLVSVQNKKLCRKSQLIFTL